MDKRSEVVEGKVKFDRTVGTAARTEGLRPLAFATTSRFFLVHVRKVVEIYCI